MAQRLISLLIGYAFGCILTAEIIVRRKTGKSVFEFGSHNPGMANVMKIFGFRAGAAVLAGDLIKTAAAALLSCFLFRQQGQIIVLYAGLGAVIGHNWPIWHKLKGGKGVSATCLTIFLFSPLWGLVSDAAGMLVVFSTGFLPLGAVVITTLFTIFAFLFHGTEAGILAAVLALIMLQRHMHGLIRILHGEETKNAQLFKKKQV